MASKRFSRILKILTGAVADVDEIIQLEGRLERFVHFWALVTRQFIRHRCFVRASALSYSTLLALIPLLAVTLNVASSLLSHPGEEKLTHFVEQAVASIAPSAAIGTNAPPAKTGIGPTVPSTNSPEEHNLLPEGMETNAAAAMPVTNAPPAGESAMAINTQTEVAQWIHELVAKTSNGALGIFGMIGLVITAILLLRGIEETFNDMWGVTSGRDWFLQIMLYWTIITLGPLLLSTALAFSSTAYLERTRSFVESSWFLAPVMKHVLPVIVLSITLGLFYKLTPNTKVELGAAMVGGFCAGAAWHFYNQLSFVLAARALSASKLYGGIFLFILVMGGLYVLWVIILFGAQIAYAYQNRLAYLQDRLAENVNQRGREFVALRVMTCLGRRFHLGQGPPTVPEISTELGVPSRLTQSVLRILAATHLVTEVTGAEAAFVPARPLESISAYDILIAMRTGTGQELPMSQAPELMEIYGEFARIEQAERNAAAGITLLALSGRVTPPAALPEPKPVEPETPVSVSGAVGRVSSPGFPVEPWTPAGVSGAVVKVVKPEPEPVELSKSNPFPEKVEPPTPEPRTEPEPMRRETVRPEETDFPL